MRAGGPPIETAQPVYRAGFELDTLEGVPPDAEACVVLTLAQCAYDVNRTWLRYHPETPPIYYSGVRYRRQNLGADRWLDIPRILATGYGSCSDLAPWRAAELNVYGHELAGLGVKSLPLVRNDGSLMMMHHVVVIRASGEEEDPSVALGMPPTAPEMALMGFHPMWGPSGLSAQGFGPWGI